MATPEAPQYIRRTRGDPPGRPGRWLALRLLDEHDPAGGRPKAALFLLHPGPSLLVTAVTVGAAAMALHAAPSLGVALRLVLLMLPAQFAIGAVNDLADVGTDREHKPHKPLVRGVVSSRLAAGVAAAAIVLSLGAAASFGAAVFGATVAGLGAGLAYDVALKRGRASWVPWWVAFTALPLCAYAAAGRFPIALWWAVPLTAVLAVALHCANALPDIEGDLRSGISSLPVLFGVRRARAVAIGGMLAAAAGTAALARPLGQTGPWLPLAWALVLLASVAATAVPRLRRAPFPLLAVAAAVLAVAWLAALPVTVAPAP
jgi:4-hydroxybenzoate polyprenyltransferase